MRCGYELKDVGRSLSWGALHSFMYSLGAESFVAKEVEPELHDWTTTLKTNKILADIYDVLSMINANLVAYGSRKPFKKPKTYPRLKPSGEKVGKEPVAPVQLRNMFVNMRKKRLKNGKH